MRETMPLQERVDHDLGELARIVDGEQPGWTRTALSDADVAGRRWVAERMRDAGLEVTVDPAGTYWAASPVATPRLG